jgi:hypothetical protein
MAAQEVAYGPIQALQQVALELQDKETMLAQLPNPHRITQAVVVEVLVQLVATAAEVLQATVASDPQVQSQADLQQG